MPLPKGAARRRIFHVMPRSGDTRDAESTPGGSASDRSVARPEWIDPLGGLMGAKSSTDETCDRNIRNYINSLSNGQIREDRNGRKPRPAHKSS